MCSSPELETGSVQKYRGKIGYSHLEIDAIYFVFDPKPPCLHPLGRSNTKAPPPSQSQPFTGNAGSKETPCRGRKLRATRGCCPPTGFLHAATVLGKQASPRGEGEREEGAGATATACTEGQASANCSHHFSEEMEAGAGAGPSNLEGGGALSHPRPHHLPQPTRTGKGGRASLGIFLCFMHRVNVFPFK